MSKQAITPETALRVRVIIEDAINPHLSFREARQSGLYVIPARDKVIELCLPLAERMVGALIRLPATSRVEVEDLEQAARLGIVEGVDTFEPSRGWLIQTHLWFRMRKRINDERALGHWVIMRPPRSLIDDYMGGNLSEDEQEAYLNRYVNPTDSIETGQLSDYPAQRVKDHWQ